MFMKKSSPSWWLFRKSETKSEYRRPDKISHFFFPLSQKKLTFALASLPYIHDGGQVYIERRYLRFDKATFLSEMKPATIEYSDIEKQFEFVDTLINKHLDRAVQNINTEMLYTYWEVGQYISERLKSSAWGEKVVTDLADYLKRRNPKRRGYGKRHLYNMVRFFDTYNHIVLES